MEIKDILAYLWVLVNPSDSLHLKRIINVPARGVGKVTVDKLENLAQEQNISLFEVLAKAPEAGVAGATAKKIQQFHQLMITLQDLMKTKSPSQFIKELVERSGYLAALKAESTLEAEGRIENLEELVNVVEDYEESTKEASFEGFLDQVALISDLDKKGEGGQALPLMTLHLAKGLEFDVVFFVGMEEGLLPHVRSFDTLEEMNEERRLTYVGMTRARKRLFLTNAQRRRVFGNDQYNLPSRFLDEIPGELLERIEAKYSDNYSQDEYSDSHAPLRASTLDRWVSQVTEDPSNPYKVGAKVKHPIFGVGTIRRCEGSTDDRKITVMFQSGDQKKLLAKFSNLTILG
jgi:DNA helicase-2/ATP-dependent DNA helicase PcrA